MENKLSVKCITTEEEEEYFLIAEAGNVASFENCDRLNFPLQICVTDTKNSYIGELTKDHVDSWLKKLKMNPSDFYLYNFQALLESGSSNYSFSLKKKSERNVTFTWKKSHALENIKCQLGQLNLSLGESDLMRRVLKLQIEQVKCFNDEIKELDADRKRLSKVNSTAMTTLNECVEAKNNLENELYGKFLLVINEKKAKIRELQSQLYGSNSEQNVTSRKNKNSDCQSSGSNVLERPKQQEVTAPKRSRRIVGNKNKTPVVKNLSPVSSVKSSSSQSTTCDEFDEDDLLSNM